MAGAGKESTSAALRGEFGDYDEGRESRGRGQGFFSIQSAVAAGDCRHLLCALLGESILAIKTRGAVSPSDYALSSLAGGRGRSLTLARHGLGVTRPRSTVSRRRMVLVPGKYGADDRHRTGRLSRHGRPLRLSALHRTLCDGGLVHS